MVRYKLKYKLLTKEEKDKLKKEYYNTEKGKNVNIRLIRVLVYGIIGIIYSIFLFLSENILAFKFLAGGLFVVSIIFIISSFRIRTTLLNDYLISKNKKHH